MVVKYKLHFIANQTKIQMTIDLLKATPNSTKNKINTLYSHYDILRAKCTK